MEDLSYTNEDFDEDQAADRLRQSKNQPIRPSSGMPNFDNTRQALAWARKNLNIENLKKKAAEKVFSPIKIGTSKLLKQAWLNCIDSWGLTLIWVNIHVFLKTIFGEKLFCKLGEEWLPPQVTASDDAGKMAGKSFGMIEVMVLLFVDVIIFFIIIAFVSLITNESTFNTISGETNANQQVTNQTAAN